MSVKIMGQVYDANLPRNEKSILLAYADHADHEGGNIYPSVGRIAWKTGYKEREVQKITRQLEDRGILIKEGQGPNGTNLFRIAIDKLPTRPDYQGCKKHTLLKNAPESSYNHHNKPLERPAQIPAYKIYVEVTGKYNLNKTQIEAISREVGTNLDSLDKWRQVVTAWALAGYKPTSITGMLDWFIKGIPQHNSKNGKDGIRPPDNLGQPINDKYGGYYVG